METRSSAGPTCKDGQVRWIHHRGYRPGNGVTWGPLKCPHRWLRGVITRLPALITLLIYSNRPIFYLRDKKQHPKKKSQTAPLWCRVRTKIDEESLGPSNFKTHNKKYTKSVFQIARSICASKEFLLAGLFTSAPFRPGTSIHIKLQPGMHRFTLRRSKGFSDSKRQCVSASFLPSYTGGFHTMHFKQVEKKCLGNLPILFFALPYQKEWYFHQMCRKLHHLLRCVGIWQQHFKWNVLSLSSPAWVFGCAWKKIAQNLPWEYLYGARISFCRHKMLVPEQFQCLDGSHR